MQETKPYEIQQQKARLKQSWEFQQEYMLQMMNDAVSWKCSSEQYNCMVRDYYIARQKHQKEVMRLNQILYHSENPPPPPVQEPVHCGMDQPMSDRIPLQHKNVVDDFQPQGPMYEYTNNNNSSVCKKRGREWQQDLYDEKRLHQMSR